MMATLPETDTEPWGAAEVPREVEIDTEDLDPRIIRAARLAAEAALNRMPLPHNSGRISNGWGPWVRWAIGIAIAGIVTAVGGFMSLHSDMSALQQAQTDTRAQVTQIYDWMVRERSNGQ